MAITGFWGSTPGLASSNPGWLTPGAAELATPPAALDPVQFAKWTREKQVEYIEIHGTGSPRSLLIGPEGEETRVSIAAGPALRLSLPGEGGRAFSPQNAGRPATAAELAIPPAGMTAETFLAWRREDQIAYLEANASALPLTLAAEEGTWTIAVALAQDVEIGAGVIQRTSGDDQPIPYYHLSGSADGTPSAIVRASAEALFPSLDGETTRLAVEDRPAEFSITPAMLAADPALRARFLASFSTWHSAYQLEYVKLHAPADWVLEIPGGPTLVASQVDPTRLYIVDALDKNAIATIPEADLARIAATPRFQALAQVLGLTMSGIAGVDSVINDQQKVTAETAVEELRAYIDQQSASNLEATFLGIENRAATDPRVDPEPVYGAQHKTVYVYLDTVGGIDRYEVLQEPLMPAADREVFTRQLDILASQLDTNLMVDPTQIRSRLSALKDRFDRAFAFWDVRPPKEVPAHMGLPDVTITTHYDVITQDGSLGGIQSAYQTFIAQERRIADLAVERMALARQLDGSHGARLDVPTLVYKFQSLYNFTLEAEVVMETEEVNQQNALLKTYAAMQALVNRTLGLFENPNDERKTILGYNDDALGLEPRGEPPQNPGMPTERQILISMFENNLGAGQKHPLERLKGVDRPVENIFDVQPGTHQNFNLVFLNHGQWNMFSTRLSEAVTILNQNSQIKMNDINSLDKQRNRHFDLANSALAKMNEIIQSIARA